MQNSNPSSLTGFGADAPQLLEEISKALSFASQNYSDTLPGDFTGAPALQVESLDKTLRVVTHEQKHLLLWNDIPKTPAYNTVEQANTNNSYGAQIPPFFTMASAPATADSGYDRNVVQIKYMGVQKQINHDVMLVRQAHGPIVQREIKNGALWILAQLERALFSADSSINGLEFDGIDKQIGDKESQAEFKAQAFDGYNVLSGADTIILDKRNDLQSGEVLDEEILEEAALVQANNFGMCTDMYMDTKAHSDFSRAFYAKERINTLGMEGKAGYVVKQFVSGSGTFNLKSGVFQRPRRIPLAAAVSAESAPTLQDANSGDNSPASGSSQFAAVDVGAYEYKCSAVYSDGETLASAAKAVTVAAGDKVVLDILPGSNPSGVQYFNIFRSPKAGSSNHEFIGRVKPANFHAGDGDFRDLDIDFNASMPGLSKAYLMQVNEDNFAFKQLLTMMKIDLALLGTNYRWMQLMYGALHMYTPRKNCIVKNIGRS